MSLPSGYTRLEYIESTGTQYISTGITPTENTKVVIEFNSSSVSGVVFGQDSGYKVNAFMFAMTVVVFESTKKNISISANAKHTVQVAPKAFKIDNGSSQYIYANKVNAAYPMFLFGNNRNGKFSEGVAMKLYSFKVYENNVLIADYIPCKQGNAVGLYDDVAGAMNLPLGTGDFTAGPSISGTHKTLVNGTVYTVKGGKCMVGGTVYNVLKGRTLIDGTGWDITFPSAGTKLSTLYVGHSVYLNVGGVRKEFLVVHQGKPSSLYDASCDGTWLLMKDIYENRQWHSPNINSYTESAIHSYLNSTFLNLFESNIQAAIKQVKIPYVNEAGSSAVASGANGLSCKVFLLSGYEVGIGGKTYLPQDGAKLSYFNLNIGMDPKRIAYLNGSAHPWWLRSPDTNSVYYAWSVNSGGGCDTGFDVGLSFGIRPCIILPSDALVDDEYNLIT